MPVRGRLLQFRSTLLAIVSFCAQAALPLPGWAQEPQPTASGAERRDAGAAAPQAPPQQPQQPKPGWQYGGFVDAAYLLDFNHPSNGLFRSRGTAWHVDEPDLNMAAATLKKPVSALSRWGVELTAQAGKDTEVFG